MQVDHVVSPIGLANVFISLQPTVFAAELTVTIILQLTRQLQVYI